MEDAEVGKLCGSAPLHPVRALVCAYQDSTRKGARNGQVSIFPAAALTVRSISSINVLVRNYCYFNLVSNYCEVLIKYYYD